MALSKLAVNWSFVTNCSNNEAAAQALQGLDPLIKVSRTDNKYGTVDYCCKYNRKKNRMNGEQLCTVMYQFKHGQLMKSNGKLWITCDLLHRM